MNIQAANYLKLRGYLAEKAEQLLTGCRISGMDGTILYTPDGIGNYNALWTRDFAYMIENAGEFIPLEHIKAAIEYLLKGQREDGWIPDRVYADGLPVYAAGDIGNPVGEANLDTAPFLIFVVEYYLKRLSQCEAKSVFIDWEKALDKSMKIIPLSSCGLVYNNPLLPHSPYGFTDTVGKTGELFFESLLYWQACLILSNHYDSAGYKSEANTYLQRAFQIEKGISVLWSEADGAFLASTEDCRQIDIWGNAYAVYIGFPLKEWKDRIIKYLVCHYQDYTWKGQIRHLLNGEYWHRQLIPVSKGEYQNGSYWATASGWIFWVLYHADTYLAEKLLNDLVEYFQTEGIYECVNHESRKLESYVVSVTNPMGALDRLLAGYIPHI